MKKIHFVIISIFLTVSIFSQEEIKNLVVIPSSKNLNGGESAWLPESICDKLESNFKTYTNYEIISSKTKEIKNYQKESETAGFDENTAIEVGKLVSASHVLFLSVSKAEKKYFVTAEIANATTGKLIAKQMISGKSKTEELFDTTGCAVDEIIIALCEQLGVPLTNIQKYILINGSMNIDDSEKLAMFNQEITNYNKQITELNKEISLLSKNTNLDATAKKAKLEAEKAIAEEKRKVAEAEKIRLAEIEKTKAEEKIKRAARNDKQRNTILEVSREVSKKAAELRKLKMNNQSSLGILRVIETKKAALIEIRENVKTEQAKIAENYEKERNAKIDEINNRPWRTAELSKGKPTEEAKWKKQADIDNLRIKYKNIIKTEQERIEKATEASQDEIYKEISTDLETLGEKIFFANTINGNLRITIGEYDGNKKSWFVKYSILCNGLEVHTGSSELKYYNLEMLKPSGMDFYDAVDMYDSLFKCNEPVLTFEISYKIKPVKERVSTYEYEFYGLKVFDTTNVTHTQSPALSGSSFVCRDTISKLSKQMSPGYDIRTEAQKVQQRIEEEKKQIKEEKERRTKEKEDAIASNESFQFGIEGSFSGAYSIISNYGTRWLMGGGGKLTLGGINRYGWGFGGSLDISYLHNATKRTELNFIPVSVHFLVERHIPIKSVVIRPQGTIGLGGVGSWGRDRDTLGYFLFSYFLLTTTFGCYFDVYMSKNIAIYFGPVGKISSFIALNEVIGIFQPSFSVGIKFVARFM